MLATATRLLAERAFDDVSLAELLRRANWSVGGFYGRFPDKEALFDELVVRFNADVNQRVLREVGLLARLSYRDRVQRLLALIVSIHIDHRPVLRSMYLRLWRDPERYRRLATFAADALLDRELLATLEIVPGRGLRATHVFATVVGGCRERLLFADLTDAQLADPRVSALIDVASDIVVAGLRAPRDSA